MVFNPIFLHSFLLHLFLHLFSQFFLHNITYHISSFPSYFFYIPFFLDLIKTKDDYVYTMCINMFREGERLVFEWNKSKDDFTASRITLETW